MSNQNNLYNLDILNQAILNDAFPYHENIKTPDELGIDMNVSSNFDSDVTKIMSYVKLLLEGNSEASIINGNLGNNYFISTPAKCTNIDTANQVERSLYINNASNNSNGLISMTNNSINSLDPLSGFKSLSIGADPSCQLVTLKVQNNGVQGTDSGYLITSDIQGLNPCLFENNTNPITTASCSEIAGFTNYEYITPQSNLPSIIKNLYFISLIVLALYILSKKRK